MRWTEAVAYCRKSSSQLFDTCPSFRLTKPTPSRRDMLHNNTQYVDVFDIKNKGQKICQVTFQCYEKYWFCFGGITQQWHAKCFTVIKTSMS